MSFYEEKRKAMQDIKNLAQKEETLEDIIFFILEKYGFGEKFVTRYYSKLKERGFTKK